MSVIYPGGTTIDHCESKRAEDGEGIPKRVFAVPRAGALATDDDDVYISWIDGAGACQRGVGSHDMSQGRWKNAP